MASSTDINPNFITAAAVSKQAARDEFTHVKDAIAALEAQNATRVISSTLVSVAVASVMIAMPTGYSRYRLEIQDFRGVSTGSLQFRVAVDGITPYSGATDYDGPALDFNASGVAASQGGGSAFTLLADQGFDKKGATGSIDLAYTRNAGLYDIAGHRSDNVRHRRSGSFGTAGTNNLGIQFFVTGGAVNIATGAIFTLLGRL